MSHKDVNAAEMQNKNTRRQVPKVWWVKPGVSVRDGISSWGNSAYLSQPLDSIRSILHENSAQLETLTHLVPLL